MFLQNFTKLKKKQHEIMRNTSSLSLIIIWKTTIETWAHEMNGAPGTNWGPGELNSSPTLEIML